MISNIGHLVIRTQLKFCFFQKECISVNLKLLVHHSTGSLVEVIVSNHSVEWFYRLPHKPKNENSFENWTKRKYFIFTNHLFSFAEHTTVVGVEGRGKKVKVKKKFKKFLLPLVIAYKLKFLALVPLLVGGLVLLVGSTGTAGFFFALFAAVICLKGSAHWN